MSLAKLLIAGVALAASTSALACGSGWGGRYGVHRQEQGYSSQSDDGAQYGGGYGGGYQASSSRSGSSYEAAGGYRSETYDLNGGFTEDQSARHGARYHRMDREAQDGGGHYGYLHDAREDAAYAYAHGYGRTEVHGGAWSYQAFDGRMALPPCRRVGERLPYGWPAAPLCPGEGELTLGGDVFTGDGGVGGFPDYDGGGGGYGYAFVGGGGRAHAGAFASASARASVSVRFRGGFHGGGHHGGGHRGGCGCGK